MAPHPGGGGLVILPHKSWNVWNEDNKAKVARDEQANAQLIQAKEHCRNKVLQEIRFERLTGKSITKQEEKARIEYALDNIDINEHIKDESMRDIAKKINDKQQREKMEENKNKNKNKNKKRKYNEMNGLSEEQIKYGQRKRHKRNDVSIIEDHYSAKSKFEFDPEQYNTVSDNKSVQNHNDNKPNNSHFSLFNERDLRNKYNKNGYANQASIKEERQKKEMEDRQFKVGRTEIELRGNRKPWYLMTVQREIDRRMLMKSDDIQRSLPRRLKDYNRNTDELKEKAVHRKCMDDPMHLMNEYVKKQKEIRNKAETVGNEREDINMQFYDSLKRNRKLKKQKKEKRRRKKQKNNDRDSDDSDCRKKRKKRKKHKHIKSSKKNKKKHSRKSRLR